MTKKPLNILYGVSTDGNGHVARAAALIPALEARGASVTTLFSGSSSLSSYDAEIFRDVIEKRGYARSVDSGHVNMFQTVAQNVAALPRMARDVLTLDLRPYDLVISDFEPISAWGRRIQNVFSSHHIPSIGIANQYSFERDVPKVPGLLMNNAHSLARAKTRLGMHFHHFGQDGILPPFIGDLDERPVIDNKILVYLGFDALDDVKAFLAPYEKYDFHIYSKQAKAHEEIGNLVVNPISRDGFRRDFSDCAGVITSGGFMTASEALHIGKKLLLKPLDGHPEQRSNVMALEALGVAHAMDDFDHHALKGFLTEKHAARIHYPDVVANLADWVMEGEYSGADRDALCHDLWEHVTYDV